MALPAPWNTVEEGIRRQQDYGQGAEKLAEFFKATEERVRADALFRILIDAKPGPKWMERFAFCLFNAGASDRQTGLRALEGRRLHRLVRRAMAGVALDEKEAELAQTLFGFMSEQGQDFEAFSHRCHVTFDRMLRHESVDPTDSKALAFFIRSEGEALKQRVNWLSENADPYNMKTMARILPRLRVYDENVDNALKMASKIDAGQNVGETRLSLESHLKEAGFAKWLKHLGEAAVLRPWALALELQRERRVPTLDLIALSTLGRYVYEARGEKLGAIEWISLALRSWNDGLFSMEAGEAAQTLKPALSSLGLQVTASRIEGNFHQKSYVALIGKDLLTRSYKQLEDEGAVDMKSLLLQNMGRDSVLEALLNNGRVYQSPGLVGYVASTCRSVAVLSKIAKSRHLYSGFANRDVPMILLQSPVNIPMSLLRPFIHTRYVAMVDLRHMSRARTGIRMDVRKEIDEYLSTSG